MRHAKTTDFTTHTTSARKCKPSQALAALITARDAAVAEQSAARTTWSALDEIRMDCQVEVTPEAQAAINAVPVSDELKQTRNPLHRMVLHFADGSIDDKVIAAPERNYTIYDCAQIEALQATDPDRGKLLSSLWLQYDQDKRAAAELHRSPEYRAAKHAADAAWRAFQPFCRRAEAAEKALWSYKPVSTEDQLGWSAFVIDELGGKISKGGAVSLGRSLELDDPDDEVVLDRLMSTLVALATEASLASVAGFNASAWIDAFEAIPGHFIDGRGASYVEPEAWPDGDHSKPPVGAVLYSSLTDEQRSAVCAVGRERRPLVPPGTDFSTWVYTPVERGGVPAHAIAAE